MGTPDFAVPTLDTLIRAPYSVVSVVTSPDKPSGRGQKLRMSPVKEYSVENNLKVLQPKNLKDPDFISQLEKLEADLFIVVAFRMLPKDVWKMPPLGTFNLHASLLPQYRGAAPINWAIINGEKESGLTTFMIDEKIDTGKILFQERMEIDPHENAGDLHDRMMLKGALLVVQTVRAIENDNIQAIPQAKFVDNNITVKQAFKIFKEDCEIIWDKPVNDNYNFIRGLSPYPGSYSYLISPDENTHLVKIYKAEFSENLKDDNPVGSIKTDNKNFLLIKSRDGYLDIKVIQLQSKKRMDIHEFLRGFQISERWKVGKIS